jgi:hypothetical protein
VSNIDKKSARYVTNTQSTIEDSYPQVPKVIHKYIIYPHE